MSDVLIRLAAPGEYEAIGELGETAYSHDYDITDGYRQRVRDVAARAAEHEAAERGAVRVVMSSGPDMIAAHQLYDSMGFTRLTERETRIGDGHTRPLLAFGYEVGHAAGL
jgi:hypothetical protein